MEMMVLRAMFSGYRDSSDEVLLFRLSRSLDFAISTYIIFSSIVLYLYLYHYYIF